jgi:hypothetical protein
MSPTLRERSGFDRMLAVAEPCWLAIPAAGPDPQPATAENEGWIAM